VAVYFTTEKPNGLLKKFIERVDQEEAKGKITTWRKHKDGEHFTHTSAEWGNKAWMKPHAEKGRLVFNIIKPKSETVSWAVYAYYHGHLIETFINHFNADFSGGQATSQPTSDDLCGG
jgi:hypothetical protein